MDQLQSGWQLPGSATRREQQTTADVNATASQCSETTTNDRHGPLGALLQLEGPLACQPQPQRGRLSRLLDGQDGSPSASSSLSLASQAQNPPSYLSAAKCATLDASQLSRQIASQVCETSGGYAAPATLHLQRQLQLQLELQQRQQQQQRIVIATVRSDAMSGRDYRPTGEQHHQMHRIQGINQAQQRQRQQLQYQQPSSRPTTEMDGLWQQQQQYREHQEHKLLVALQLQQQQQQHQQHQQTNLKEARARQIDARLAPSEPQAANGSSMPVGGQPAGAKQSTLAAAGATTSQQATANTVATTTTIGAYRKRRRHKEASSSQSDAGDSDAGSCPGEPLEGWQEAGRAPQSADSAARQQRAISAHCWLIDSSDEQSAAGRPRSHQMAASLSQQTLRCQDQHYQQRHLQLSRQLREKSHSWRRQASCGELAPLGAATMSVAERRRRLRAAAMPSGRQFHATLRGPNLDRKFAFSARWLNDVDSGHHYQAGSSGGYSAAAFDSLRAKASSSGYSTRSAPVPTRSSAVSTTKRGAWRRNGNANKRQRRPASKKGHLAPLAAVMSLFSHLFSPASWQLASNKRRQDQLVGGNTTANPMLPSSSSSTSAYATGSSRLSQQSSSLGAQQAAAAAAAAPRQLYSSVSLPNSGPRGPPSSVAMHSYAYCDVATNSSQTSNRLHGEPQARRLIDDDDDDEQFELVDLGANVDCNQQRPDLAAELASSSTNNSNTLSAQRSNSSESESDARFGFVKPVSSSRHSEHQPAFSDYELISSAASQPEASGLASSQRNAASLPRCLASGGGSSRQAIATAAARQPRRRTGLWRLRSMAWRSWQPNRCLSGTQSDSPDSIATGSAAGAASSKASGRHLAASYQNLAGSKQTRARAGSSTLENIVALAKVDSNFRARLVASIVISCLLLGLLGLLASQIARRRGSSASLFELDDDSGQLLPASLASLFGQQHQSGSSSSKLSLRSKLSLLIDDSDQDLGWLWPNQPAGYPVEQTEPADEPTKPGGSIALDSKLALVLLRVQSSKLLEHFHATMLHLANIQLANDNFVDLTRLSKYLAKVDNFQLQDESDASSRMAASQQETKATTLIQLNEADQDLVGLILLSNLYWPVVKWRHQNQRSLAGFLAFALPISLPSSSRSGSSISVSASGELSMRKLLAVLLLTEVLVDNKPNGADTDQLGFLMMMASSAGANLAQFARLNQQLKRISYHLISCAHLQAQLGELDAHSRRLYAKRFKFKFCKLLVSRYKLQLSILSQADHSKLHKLQLPAEGLFLTNNNNNNKANQQQFEQQRARSGLVGFLLDRLAIIDVDLLAETVLAQNSQLAEQIYFEQDETTNQNSKPDEQLIEHLLRKDSFVAAYERLPVVLGELGDMSELDANNNRKQGRYFDRLEPQSSVFELSKQVIGESASQLNIELELKEPIDVSLGWKYDRLLSRGLLYPWTTQRLPLFIKAQSYDLFLHPNLTTGLLVGMVKLEFELERASNFLVLNSKHLNLIELNLWQKQQQLPTFVGQHQHHQANNSSSNPLKQIAIRHVLINKKLEQIYIELPERLQASSSVQLAGDKQFQPTNQDNLNFGELGAQPLPSYRLTNRYVLMISFNKTKLTGLSEQEWASDGLKLVHYSDSFAQQPESELKSLLYTQFEASNARKVFPCLDEPKFKAKFQLNLVHEQHQSSMFNAAKRELVPYSQSKRLQMSVFEPTRAPICTYMLAFVVYDSQSIRALSSRAYATSGDQAPSSGANSTSGLPIQVQILSQYELLSQAEFSSQLVPKLLNFYQQHLAFAYPLDKLDLFALPRGLSAGDRWPTQEQPVGQQAAVNQDQQQLQQQQRDASLLDTMENLGLIWFKSSLLLIDSNLISQDSLEQTGLIIAHQVAHQYFGNIVSLREWQDYWLFEALCQYLEAFALSQVERDWRLDEQPPVASIEQALALELHQPAGAGAAMPIETANVELESAIGAASQQRPLEPLRLASASNIGGPDSQIKSSATLHMLLLNLLASSEARGRLLRRCLISHQFGTMSGRMFWRQLVDQLQVDDPSSRMLDQLARLNTSSEPSELNQLDDGHQEQQLEHHAEQVIFVGQRQVAANDSAANKPQVQWSHHHHHNQHQRQQQHQQRPLSEQPGARPVSRRQLLADRLEWVADSWLSNAGYPLVTASVHRDRVQLRQEPFSFAWWELEVASDGQDLSELASMESETVFVSSSQPQQQHLTKRELLEDSPDSKANNSSGADWQPPLVRELTQPASWPIPLMFVSRYNPKQARFMWLLEHEMELPFGSQLVWPNSHSGLAPPNDYSSARPTPSGASYAGHLGSPGGLPTAWLKLNVNQSSLVRVNYDERNWESLINLLIKSHYSNHLLGPLDRANLIDDSLTLMRCGKVSVGIAMNLTLYLELGERDYAPWTSALRHLDQMQTLLNQNPLWHRYVLKLIQPISSVIGWKDDGPHLMRKLRRNLFSVALQYGDDKIVAKAKQDFKSWLKSSRFIVPNLQELVYVAGVRYGDLQEWFHCWHKYQQLVQLSSNGTPAEARISSPTATTKMSSARTSYEAGGGISSVLEESGGVKTSAESNLLNGIMMQSRSTGPLAANLAAPSDQPNVEDEKRQLLTALASTQNTWLLEQFLNNSMDSNKIQASHMKLVIQTLGKNPVARLYLWRFVRLNWSHLVNTYSIAELGKEMSANEVTPVAATAPVQISDELASGASRLSDDSMVSPDKYHQILETMIKESTKHFATKLDYDEVRSFFDSKRKQTPIWNDSVEAAIQRSLQIIRSNIYWREYIEPKLTKWLAAYDRMNIN